VSSVPAHLSPTDKVPEPVAQAIAMSGRARRSRELRRKVVVRIVQLALLGAVLGIWQNAGSSQLGKVLYSTPTDVVRVLRSWATDSAVWSDLGVTLREALLGYAIGASFAVLLALLLLTSPFAQRFTAPFVAAMGALPKVAMAPLFGVWFGLGITSKVAFVVSITFFLVFWGVTTGLRAIDPVYIQNTRLLGARRLWMLREVYLPATVGWVMTSLRVCISWAFIGATIAEYLAASHGIGFRVRDAQALFRQDVVVSGILVISIVALLFDRGLWRVERRFSRWRLG
jgi:NitT/TauT family transport system permease protein